jgi:hypothetical protein
VRAQLGFIASDGIHRRQSNISSSLSKPCASSSDMKSQFQQLSKDSISTSIAGSVLRDLESVARRISNFPTGCVRIGLLEFEEPKAGLYHTHFTTP